MRKFKMPGLSKYVFDGDGNCNRVGKKGVKRYKGDGQRYLVFDDMGNRHYIHQREIIQYGKHLAEVAAMEHDAKFGIATDILIKAA